MKKIFTLVMMLACFGVLTSQAQRSWTVEEQSTDAILEGEENIYVLREGVGGHSQNGFLSTAGGDKCATAVDITTIFSFIKVGDKVEDSGTYAVYVLKNLGNNKYLSAGGEGFVNSPSKAFRFTARKAKAFDSSNDAYTKWDWETYSQGVDADKCADAEAQGAWVLCSETERLYIGFYQNPSFMGYVDTNNWLILKATEDELSAFDKFVSTFDTYFVTDINEEVYPIGDAPGCVSEELFNAMKAVYDEASAATQVKPSDEVCNELTEKIINIFARYEKEVCKVGPGYFLLVNGRSNDAAYDAGNMVKTTLKKAAPDAWNLANAKFIWQIENAKKPGEFFIKNWGTGKYVGKQSKTSSAFPLVNDSTDTFIAKQTKGVWFLISDSEKHGFHNDGGGKVVRWEGTDGGNQWRFDKVHPDTIAKLEKAVSQDKMNKSLAQLISAGKQTKATETVSGFINEGEYAAPMDSGLTTKVIGTNAQEKTEGSIEGLFDGDLNTFYHSSWHDDNAPEGYHWIKVDLGKAVEEIVIKMSKRERNNNGTPTKLQFVGADNDDPSATEWTVPLADVDTCVYTFNTNYGGHMKDSCTYIDTVKFNQPARYIQMNVTRTVLNKMVGTADPKVSGPFWHVTELRFYDLAECVESPEYANIPADVKKTLADALAAAQTELDSAAATQKTYDALEAAIDAFWEAYPDPTTLMNKLKTVAGMTEGAQEGETLGFFKTGAIDALKAAVAEIQGKVDAKMEAKGAFTLDELKALEKQLDAAVETFNTNLITPENGQVFHIVCNAGYNANGEPEPQHNGCIVALNADHINGTPMWRYNFETTDLQYRLNSMWKVEKSKDGFAFKNLANGLYMGNAYEGLSEEELEDAEIAARIGFSKKPKHYNLEAFTSSSEGAGSFLFRLTDGQFVNLDPTGTVVHWADRNDTHAALKFEPVDPELYENIYKYDVTAGKTQIISLPIDIANVFTIGIEGDEPILGGAYKVLGQKEGAVQLDLYSEETIPAGTPFIITTLGANPEVEGDKGETVIDLELSAPTLEDCYDLNYVYEPIEQKGLVSAPVGFEATTGFGVIVGKTVILAEGDYIEAGTGFFNKNIPEVEEEGTFQLVLESPITGEGTGVEAAIVSNKEKVNVYTISGVKVRSNIKAAAATKGLPKGLYIVGGKKVIVK